MLYMQKWCNKSNSLFFFFNSPALNPNSDRMTRSKACLICCYRLFLLKYFHSCPRRDQTITFQYFPSDFGGLCYSSRNHLHTNLKFGHLARLGTIEPSQLCVCCTGQASAMVFVSVSKGAPSGSQLSCWEQKKD